MPTTIQAFSPPRAFSLGNMQLKMLSPAFADVDFAAVMASADAIRHLFGPAHDWPEAEMTFEQNQADLARHEREFNEQKAFAYALLDASGKDYLGCLYLEPLNLKSAQKTAKNTHARHVQIQAFIWISSLHANTELAPIIAQVNAWLAAHYELDAIAWPGRVESWEEWATYQQPALS